MSDHNEYREPELISGAGSGGRPQPLSRDEYEALLSSLQIKALPLLQRAKSQLLAEGFTTAKVESIGGLTGVHAVNEYPYLEARLRIQVHDSFAPLVRPDPFFWVFTVFGAHGMLQGSAGRLSKCCEETLSGISRTFVESCRKTRNSVFSAVGAYFDDVISLGLDREEFRSPPMALAEVLALTGAQPGLLRTVVVPMLELAAGKLAGRFPAWRAKVSKPNCSRTGTCGLTVKSIARETTLRFALECGPAGDPGLWFETICDGRKAPAEAVETSIDEVGYSVRASCIQAAIGEFLYSVVFISGLSEGL
jgi:hypothetical protein